MPIPWSAPAYEQGVTPAIASSRYEVSAPNIGHVLASIIADRQHQQAQTQQSISEAGKAVAGIMNQRKQDQIAQAMLDQASNYDNENPSQSEAMARSLNESDLHPVDAWSAFTGSKAAQFKDAAASIQQQKLDLMRQKLENQPDAGTSPIVDPTTGMVWNGSRWIRSSGSKSKSDPWENAVPVARGRLNTEGNFDNQYAEADTGPYVKLQPPTGKPLVVPWDEYQKRTGGSAAATPSQPQASAPQVGEQRTINGVLAEWDGQGWVKAE